MSDLIDRQAAIDALTKYIHNMDKIIGTGRLSAYDCKDAATSVFDNLPSAHSKQKWIPVTERLPDKPNTYTVTDSNGNVVRFVFYDTESSRKYWLRCAKAWMPLPEPYQEEGEK